MSVQRPDVLRSSSRRPLSRLPIVCAAGWTVLRARPPIGIGTLAKTHGLSTPETKRSRFQCNLFTAWISSTAHAFCRPNAFTFWPV